MKQASSSSSSLAYMAKCMLQRISGIVVSSSATSFSNFRQLFHRLHSPCGLVVLVEVMRYFPHHFDANMKNQPHCDMLHRLRSPEHSFHAVDIGTLMQFLAERKSRQPIQCICSNVKCNCDVNLARAQVRTEIILVTMVGLCSLFSRLLFVCLFFRYILLSFFFVQSCMSIGLDSFHFISFHLSRKYVIWKFLSLSVCAHFALMCVCLLVCSFLSSGIECDFAYNIQ